LERVMMAIIKKTELDSMTEAEKAAKIAELEKAMLELRGESRKDKAKPLRKAIAKLKTPRPAKSKKAKA
jgi:ribosomal protein L29